MSNASPGNMSSVWETLNRMKARQQAAAQSAKTVKKSDTSRRDAQIYFEELLKKSKSPEQVLRQLTSTDNESVRSIIDTNKERLTSDDNIRREISAVKRIVSEASNDLQRARIGSNKAAAIASKF